MIERNRKNIDPDKLKEWRTLAIAEIHEELPETKVSVPSEISVDSAKEFAEVNHI